MTVMFPYEAENPLKEEFFGHSRRGFYVDVGANDPDKMSVTRALYERGWRGINIEPVPDLFGRLRERRPRDLNLNLGISNRSGHLAFYKCTGDYKWSTFSAAQAENLRREGLRLAERPVPVATLAGVCERHVTGAIDFLKIDAEGHDLKVLRGGHGLFAARAVAVAQFEYGMSNIDSRDLLKDFFAFFAGTRYNLHKIHAEGFSHYPRYNVRLENFQYQNWLVVRQE